MALLNFLNEQSSAIQAAVAIANLIIIGFLTIKSYILQNKLMQTEQFFKVQNEYDQCKSSINNYIQYFEIKSGINSNYLKQLYEISAGDGDSEALAKYSLERMNKIIDSLKKIKIKLEIFNDEEILKSIDASKLQRKLKKLISLKYLVQNKNPTEFYEHKMSGPQALWVDDEIKIEESLDGSEEMINEISKAVDSLKN